MIRKGGAERGMKGNCGRGYSYGKRQQEQYTPTPVMTFPTKRPCDWCDMVYDHTETDVCPKCGEKDIPF